MPEDQILGKVKLLILIPSEVFGIVRGSGDYTFSSSGGTLG